MKDSPFILAKSYIITTVSVLIPLFFLPFTQEYFITNKFYLLNIAALAILVISAIEVFLSGKINWKFDIREIFVGVFIAAVGISTFFVSPNPTQALLNPNFNILLLASLAIIYIQAIRTDVLRTVIIPVLASSIVVSTLAVLILIFKPFSGINLPTSLQFLKNPGFTTIGTQVDLAVFLAFTLILTCCLLFELFKKSSVEINKTPYWVVIFLSGSALMTVVYFIISQDVLQSLPSFKLSLFAGLEILKNPISALFGAGVDSFSTIFTRIKDLDFNQSSQWQIGSFTTSRSVYLHIFTETGLVGLTAFLIFLLLPLVIIFLKKEENQEEHLILPYIFLVLIMFIVPPSLILFFLLFVSLTFVYNESLQEPKNIAPYNYFLAALIFFGSLGLIFYLGKTYLADYNMKKSFDAIARNDVNQLYDGQRKAIILNPKNESYRIAFSQVNSLLARNVASKVAKTNTATSSAQLTEQDRQIIAQSIQASITEAKAAVALNPQKASSWENLAAIYRGIIKTVEGADAWTISSYQRAISLDPRNPSYHLSLGGVHYSLGNYANALTYFEQATALKPDWSNAYYNLAWAAFYTKDYTKAIKSMEKVISLTDKQKNLRDYDKAVQELAQFKKATLDNVAGASSTQ